ncbi:MAG: hypothetical protein Q4F88_04495 [Eubacteriales bacterium]|nr:hypothetical protein [Eubacteriales bacterium]
MLKISYLEKLPFKGSIAGLRYLIKKNIVENNVSLLLCTYPDILCFEDTKEEEKNYKEFEYSDCGINESINYINTLLEKGNG